MCKHKQQQELRKQRRAAAAAAASEQQQQLVEDGPKRPQQPESWQLERKYTLSEVQQHCSLDDCWMVIFDKVYDITAFVDEHPGGDFILLEHAGRDATHAFLSSRHGSSAYKMLDKYWIGILVDEELYYSNNSSYCSVYSNLSWRSTPTLEETKSSSEGAEEEEEDENDDDDDEDDDAEQEDNDDNDDIDEVTDNDEDDDEAEEEEERDLGEDEKGLGFRLHFIKLSVS